LRRFRRFLIRRFGAYVRAFRFLGFLALLLGLLLSVFRRVFQLQHAIVNVLARGLVYPIAARPDEQRLGILNPCRVEYARRKGN
jgi:hypothetical protein